VSTDPIKQHLGNAERHYAGMVTEVARALRDLAARVEREGTLRPERDVIGVPAGAWSAHQVVHAVMWGVANLGLDGLVTIAAEIDTLRREVHSPTTREDV
jgi:hypothetical protein